MYWNQGSLREEGSPAIGVTPMIIAINQMSRVFDPRLPPTEYYASELEEILRSYSNSDGIDYMSALNDELDEAGRDMERGRAGPANPLYRQTLHSIRYNHVRDIYYQRQNRGTGFFVNDRHGRRFPGDINF